MKRKMSPACPPGKMPVTEATVPMATLVPISSPQRASVVRLPRDTTAPPASVHIGMSAPRQRPSATDTAALQR